MSLTDLQRHSRDSVIALQKYLREKSLDAFIVTELADVRYLTTFTGTSGTCVIFPDESYFLTDFRYKTQAEEQVRSCAVVIHTGNVFDALARKFLSRTSRRKKRVGVEDTLQLVSFDMLSKKIGGNCLVKTTQVVEWLAARKSPVEVALIKQACSISGSALDILVQEDWSGKVESDISAMLEFNQKVLGAERESFETIVASGLRGALPHGVASRKEIDEGELVTIDFGSFYQGYASDITRTFSTGLEVKPALRKIYNVVVDAQQKGIEAARAGIKAREVDRAAREYIEKKGYGKYFGHGTGHGIGLRIHELPRMSKTSKDVLEEGNVITIEPGIYVPKVGGVRIEDDFLVKRDGVEQLSHFSKEMDYYVTAYGK